MARSAARTMVAIAVLGQTILFASKCATAQNYDSVAESIREDIQQGRVEVADYENEIADGVMHVKLPFVEELNGQDSEATSDEILIKEFYWVEKFRINVESNPSRRAFWAPIVNNAEKHLVSALRKSHKLQRRLTKHEAEQVTRLVRASFTNALELYAQSVGLKASITTTAPARRVEVSFRNDGGANFIYIMPFVKWRIAEIRGDTIYPESFRVGEKQTIWIGHYVYFYDKNRHQLNDIEVVDIKDSGDVSLRGPR